MPELSDRGRDFVAAAAVIATLSMFVAGRAMWQRVAPRPSEAQCAALLERYLDKQSRARDPAVDDADVEIARARAAEDPARPTDLGACQRELTEAQVECGLRSNDVDQMERCLP
jgi:hypothetical protein